MNIKGRRNLTFKLLSPIEDDPYELLRDSSIYLCDRRPTAHPSFPGKAMNKKLLEELRRSSEAIQVSSSSTTIYCSIRATAIEALHDPTTEACIMSGSSQTYS